MKHSIQVAVLWVLIAFPYAFAVSPTLSDGSFWHMGRVGLATALIALTAGIAVWIFTVLHRGHSATGGIVGVTLVSLVFAALEHASAIKTFPGEVFHIAIWSLVAGIACGGLWQRVALGNNGFILNETNVGWIAGTAWIVILHLCEIITARRVQRLDTLFGAEVLTFVPVLLWSKPGVKLLYRRAKVMRHSTTLLSFAYAFATEEISAICIFPVAFLARGLGGTEEALVLLAGIPGPGIVWGVVMGWLLSPGRMPPRMERVLPAGRSIPTE
jgi:hypothetical protein